MTLRSFLFASVLLLAPGLVQAADVNGEFSVRGAGRFSCVELLDGLEKKDQRLTIFATWLDGYLTANNQLFDETFDMTPWQTTELLLAMAGRSCAARKDANFMDVIGRLIAEMRPLRLRKNTGIMRIASADKVQVHYKETVERVRARLVQLGYEFSTDSVAGQIAHAEMERNLLDFQKQSGLPPSGEMDQHTLLNLFVRPTPTE